MGILFFDGFESGNLQLWDAYNAAAATPKGGFSGAYGANIPSGDGYLYKRLSSSISEIYLHFLWYINSTYVYGHKILAFMSGSTVIAYLGFDTDRKFYAYRGAFNTLLATGSTICSLGVAHRLEVHYKAHDTTGVFQLKINGNAVLDIDFSGDTCDSATSFDGIAIGDVSGGFRAAGYDIDDVVLSDSDWIGRCRVQALVPTGAGNSSQHTGAYADVAAIPPVDTTKIYTNSADQLTTFTLTELTGSVDTVKAVMVTARSKSQGLVTPKNLKLAVRTNNSDYLSADKAVPYGGDPRALAHIWTTNPATSVDWIVPDINSLQIGVKSAT